MTRRIAMWSCPRSLSTAMLRSWETRADTWVEDEPLYGCFLHLTGAQRPGMQDSLDTMSLDWREVVHRLDGPVPGGREILFQKHHALHLVPEIDQDWIISMDSFFLIRDPFAVVASYARIRPSFTSGDLGYQQLLDLFRMMRDRGRTPLVVDAGDLARNPRRCLERLCLALRVRFDDCMLSWPPGRRAEDPPVDDPWYQDVQKTTGFIPLPIHRPQLAAKLQQIAADCDNAYQILFAHRI